MSLLIASIHYNVSKWWEIIFIWLRKNYIMNNMKKYHTGHLTEQKKAAATV